MKALSIYNGTLTHLGPDKHESRTTKFSMSDITNAIIGTKSLDYILGNDKQTIIRAVIQYLSGLDDTCSLHYFQYISPKQELKNYPFTFLVSYENENEIVFL